jgi:DNA-binding HxlR family transcriptional regulator
MAADVLGDRWTLLILREMVAGGATRFNEIERCLPKVSRSLLAQRLRHLERMGLVDVVPMPSGRGHEYHATPPAKELEPVIMAMGEWAARWLFDDPEPDELDSTFLMWWLHRRIHLDQLPAGRTVVRFDLLDAGREVYWLVLERAECSVCVKDPGLPVDLWVTADLTTFHRVFSGRITLADALSSGRVTIEGPGPLVRQFPRWMAWSPLHDAVEAATRRGPRAARR